METKRDISIVSIGGGRSLVIACDVSGGIGPKNGDKIKVDGKTVGLYTTRVALMEVMAVGAKPISVIDTLSVEYSPTGKDIIKGIEKALMESQLDKSILNGSTEDNINTQQTGVGITVVGIIENEYLKINNTNKGDILTAIGLPLVGEEVLDHPDIRADIFDLQKLNKKKYSKEMMVVGSKGIKYEAELMAEMSDLELNYDQGLKLDLEKSAGPATVILVSLAKENLLYLREDFSYKPVHQIAKFI